MKKAIALALSLALSLGMLAGCGGKSGGGGSDNSNVPSYASLNVGTDHTDLKAELRVITHRTDLVDTTFAGYVAEFNKLYPNIKINYESITNYADDMTARFWRLNADGTPDQSKPVVEPWKCPYHNGRMCLELIRRNPDVYV